MPVKQQWRKLLMLKFLLGHLNMPPAVIVTLDADLHTMLAVSRATGPSVIRLRIEGMRTPEVVKVIGGVLEDFGHELQDGALVTVKAHKVTNYRLPIGGWNRRGQ